jgi:hypothetical protein
MALPITIPFTFGNATTTQSLSSLDTNFTTITNSVNGLTNGASQINVASISATGTANATTYLRGDGAWATISGGGSGTVTSINANSSIGFTFTGGPVTSSGTLTLSGPTPGTLGNVLTSNGTAWVSQASAAAGTANVITYNSSSTWTKATDVPAGCTMALIEVWAGGGGGARYTGGSQSGGGGGGGYTSITVPISSLSATETVTVGAGGLGATATGVGGLGGTTSFGTSPYITAYGGGGGNNSATAAASKTDLGITSVVSGGGGTTFSNKYNGVTGYFDGTGFAFPLPALTYGGNGAGYTTINGQPQVIAGSSTYGGGGGGGLTGAFLVAGTSTFGGNGGTGAATPTAGTQPGGGGGASSSANVNGAAGGAGRVKVTMW